MSLRPASESVLSATRFLTLYRARLRRAAGGRRRPRSWSLDETAALRWLVLGKLGNAIAKTPRDVYREVLEDRDISLHLISRALVWLAHNGHANRTTSGGYLLAARRTS